MGILASKYFCNAPDKGLRTLPSKSALRSVNHPDEFERMISEFISTASHELRTPLTSILGFSEILLNQEKYGVLDSEKQGEFLGYIYERAKALTSIVDTLLCLDHSNNGQGITLNRDFCTIESMINEVLAPYPKGAERHWFEVLLPDGPTEVWVDRKKILQVLENLISNAVQYSPVSRVRVTGVRTGDCFHISVEDQGIGMTSEQVEKVFNPFCRVDASNTAVGGIGLGLSVTKAIVEAHGGEILVKSKLGRGTKVTLTNLPRMGSVIDTEH